MEVLLAKEAGFCFGVRRALKLAERTLAKHLKAFSFGPLIHNPQVVERLKAMGLEPVDDLSEISEGPVVIRSHGARKEVIQQLKERGIEVVDATCPKVKRVQRLAQTASRRGYFVMIVGERDHAEVQGIMSYAEGETAVVDSAEEIPGSVRGKKVAVLCQTTQEPEKVGCILKELFGMVTEMLVYNTLCEVTLQRQREALRLSSQVDCMVVVGGRKSANTRRLVEMCRRIQPRTLHIEGPEELREEFFRGAKRVGITAGASTPPELIEAVYRTLVTGDFCGIKSQRIIWGERDGSKP